MKTKCPACNGKRYLMAQGGFRKECETCKGTGRVNIEEKKEETKSAQKKPKKKRRKTMKKKA